MCGNISLLVLIVTGMLCECTCCILNYVNLKEYEEYIFLLCFYVGDESLC